MRKSYIKPQLRSVIVESSIICTSPNVETGGKDNPTPTEPNPSGDAKHMNWFDD